MRLATWNVNSLKVRLPHVLDWLAANPIDALCLQELKMSDDAFPIAALHEAGYQSFFAGQKTYNGVAILVRNGLTIDEATVVRNMAGFEDPQQRLIAVTIEGVRVISAYFPNGQAPGTEKFAYKLRWLDALQAWLAGELATHPRLALLGDFNIAPEDRDVHDPAKWIGQNLVSDEERDAFRRLLALGLSDAFRLFEQEEKAFSWWDYRMFAFRRNAGLRIDHILLSESLRAACTGAHIDREPRKREQPSDHTPVVAEIDLARVAR
ncbi:exodeoxyribonuclease III [Chitinasiproducens palmae]|uniref:Exodeoxyribonuclease III n=1 Tax=Chitinasiproducens palmae TaxID=1770053 RepID=A0A1H2PM00_9BURK|nr:exodeoxyribonuclease III [Chitinasiproducens palmae]SDV47587.1 Exodeoxyribonuclease III [Chitinasiproducens palmae]